MIYIDQFAVSNMMKAINVTMESHSKAAAEPFWLELFEALERVCKLQLVVCPDSRAHHDESLMVPYFQALKRMYEQVSHGVTFYDGDSITQMQVATALSAWLRGEQSVFDFNPERVTYGHINEWHERYLITVDVQYPAGMVEDIRRIRDSMHSQAEQAFEYYSGSGQLEFEHWVKHERQESAEAILEAARLYAQRLREMAASGEFDFSRVYKSKGFDTFKLIWEGLEARGVSPEKVPEKIRGFLSSDAYHDAPANRISTLMWAVIAHRAANGQRKAPNRGVFNDIDVVSTLMPYCDAMLLDRECAALLGNIPKRYPLSYDTRIFSLAARDEFLKYLKELEAAADPAVLASGRDVYGDDWPKPFLTMYEARFAGRTDSHGE